MAEKEQQRNHAILPRIVVAGDVCLDVISVPIPAPAAKQSGGVENWRLTGEKRTCYLRGGSMLLAQMIESTVGNRAKVVRPDLPVPAALGRPKDVLQDTQLERLTRDEIVHSLLEADAFSRDRKPESQKDKTVWRLLQAHGFSGPALDKAPTLRPTPPTGGSGSRLVVLDDTGNQFRRDDAQWPAEITAPGKPEPLILLKLHRPLPVDENVVKANQLWKHLRDHHADRTVVVVNIDDLREVGANISARLSWEKTALDLARELRGNYLLKALRDCRWLIVRCGLDGAFCWHRPGEDNTRQDRLWLVYDRERIEGDFQASVPGSMAGFGSAFTAGLVANLLEADDRLRRGAQDDLPAALGRGLSAGLHAARALLTAGYGTPPEPGARPEPEVKYPLAAIGKPADTEKRSPFHEVRVPLPEDPGNPDGEAWSILKTLLPGGSLLDKAAEGLAVTGEPCSELTAVPVGTFGGLVTYDRREIEAYRAVSNLIREYLANPAPKRPLCLAVFGPPGSGKSFGVEEVAKSVSTGDVSTHKRVFNLSQFRGPDELAAALHLVRDDVIGGRVPLVFFDEFDAALDGHPLYWLKYLLAPMQDGSFRDAGDDHPIGKAIFVFAGGISSSYDEFSRKPKDADDEKVNRDTKRPDFISRLRGKLNIPGIDHTDGYRGTALLRRANVLRFMLKNKAPALFDVQKTLRIAPGILRAFLNVTHFQHGVRSLEAVLDMSRLGACHAYDTGCLPSVDQLALHVLPFQTKEPGPGFMDLVRQASPFPTEKREKIAQAIHADYLANQKPLIPDKPSHRPWDGSPGLSEFYKDSNRTQADDIPRKLRLMKLEWREGPAPRVPILTNFDGIDDNDLKTRLEEAAQQEHDRWFAERHVLGWTYGEKQDDTRKISPAMLEWEKLPETEREKDRKAIRGIPGYLKAGGYVVLAPG